MEAAAGHRIQVSKVTIILTTTSATDSAVLLLHTVTMSLAVSFQHSMVTKYNDNGGLITMISDLRGRADGLLHLQTASRDLGWQLFPAPS